MLGESSTVSTTTTHSHHQDKKAEPKISTRGESFDSLLGESTSETNNEASITTSPSQPKSRSHKPIESIINNNNESLNLLLEEAIEMTNKSS